MNYKKYFITYYNYKQAKIKLQNIQNEIADIISSMLSTTSQMREIVNSNKSSNDKMMELTTRKIELDSKEELAKELLGVYNRQMLDAEKELKDSKETKDIIYYKYFIQHIKVKEISKDIAFAREYTYDLLKQIKSDIAKLEQELIKKNKKK